MEEIITNETPTWAKLLKDAIRKSELELHVSMPVRVEKKYSGKDKVDVQPLLKKKYAINDGEEKKRPIIPSVPIRWPASSDGKAFLKLPVKKGDTGHVVFIDRSIDVWLSGDGSIVSPQDSRTHDLSDAVFEPGLRTFKKTLEVDSEDNAYFQNDKMKVELLPDGKIKIEGATKEVMAVVSSWMGHVKGGTMSVSTIVTNAIPLVPTLPVTGAGTANWNSATQAQLTSDKNDFDTMKA